MDAIDIAQITEPKSRVISLEPISRRARAKPNPQKRASTGTDTTGKEVENESLPKTGKKAELDGVIEESDCGGSPAPSDTSFGSRMSSGNASGTEYGIRSINTNVETGSKTGIRTTLKGKTITATIDVLKGGFLRGDSIPIKISINHTKHVRSLKGVIITLYRQARVDMHPALPVAPNSKGDKTKSEDYYPKSRTGLGGLSLSSAGSSHLFRKDLSQSFAPLFVDPRTLTAEVKGYVRVPDEAFPTISNVPGAMISFKYFIEVVVDIQGKLTGLDRMLPNGNLVSVPSAYGNAPGAGRNDDPAGGMYSTWGGNFVDTDAIRRERGVISCIFEVIVGTKDSERNGKRKQPTNETGQESQAGVHEIPVGVNEDPYASGAADSGYYGYDEDGQYYDHYAYDESYQGYYDTPAYQEASTSQPPYHHPPILENEEGLSEKERMRRAEARLLPSQPPVDVAGPSSPSVAQRGVPASAPMLPEDDELHPPYFPPESSSSVAASNPPPFPNTISPSSLPSTAPVTQQQGAGDDTWTTTAGSSLTINATTRQQSNTEDGEANGSKPLPPLPPQSPAAPAYFPSSSSHVQPTDDKQELQRRRLEMETSAPLTESEEDTSGPSAPPTTDMQNRGIAPSAPILDEDDEELVGAVRPSSSRVESGRRGSEALPVYEK